MLSYSPFRNPPRKPGNLAPTFLEDGTVQIYSINIPPTAHYIFIGGTRQARGGKKLCNNVCCSRSYCGHLWPLNSGGDSVCVGVEVIITTESRISFSFQLSFLFWQFPLAKQLPQIEGSFRKKSSCEDD